MKKGIKYVPQQLSHTELVVMFRITRGGYGALDGIMINVETASCLCKLLNNGYAVWHELNGNTCFRLTQLGLAVYSYQDKSNLPKYYQIDDLYPPDSFEVLERLWDSPAAKSAMANSCEVES